jgi:hypothetical protein
LGIELLFFLEHSPLARSDGIFESENSSSPTEAAPLFNATVSSRVRQKRKSINPSQERTSIALPYP